jgi:hypothetical protein
MNRIERSDCSLRELSIILAKYIKKRYKTDNCIEGRIKVNVSLKNIYNENKGRFEFVRSEIEFDDTNYFFNRPISIDDFKTIQLESLKQSGIVGDVQIDCSSRESKNKEIISEIILFCSPCKEFIKLNHFLTKYTKRGLNQFDISSVVEKRENNDIIQLSKSFLCYQPKECNTAIEFILQNKGSKKLFDFSMGSTIEKINELCSNSTTYLELKVTTPTNRKEVVMNIYPHSYGL